MRAAKRGSTFVLISKQPIGLNLVQVKLLVSESDILLTRHYVSHLYGGMVLHTGLRGKNVQSGSDSLQCCRINVWPLSDRIFHLNISTCGCTEFTPLSLLSTPCSYTIVSIRIGEPPRTLYENRILMSRDTASRLSIPSIRRPLTTKTMVKLGDLNSGITHSGDTIVLTSCVLLTPLL